MRKLLKLMGERLSAGEDLVLVTVVASSGATPRGAGARMLVGRDGRLYGTIGGGEVEYRSEHIAQDVLRERQSRGHDFTLTKDDVQNLGMICGGAVNVFFHFIPGGDGRAIALADDAEARFERGESFWLVSDLARGGELFLADKGSAPEWLRPCLARHPRRVTEGGRDLFAEQINSPGRVYVFGCGHVAQELVPVLSHLGFRCVALDDRPDFADRALFPSAEEVKLIDFERVADFVDISAEDYVCVMTRGHAFDTAVQAQVLRSPAAYIGVIGSRGKIKAVREILRAQGFTDADFERITTPIGLDIKAETPAEIAISIAAQLIEFRARRAAE